MVLGTLSLHVQNSETRFQSSINCTSINSTWIKDLNLVPGVVKLIQRKIGSTLGHIGIGNNFMNETPVAQQLRERIDKRDCMKLRSFFTTKEMITRLKRQPTENLWQLYI
jgi:hypothetical protein